MLTHARLKLFAGACLFAICAVAPPAAGSSQTPPTNGDSRPIVRVITRVVQVGVIVHDQHGRPVRGLKAEDFVVSDNGKPQEVSFFLEASGTSHLETSASQQKVALPPHTYTNLLEQRTDAPSSLTVLLLDGLNTSWQNLDDARRQFARFIATQVRPQDRIAVFTLGRELRMLHDFSNDTSTLIRAMSGLSGDGPAGTALAGEALPTVLLAGAVTDISGVVAEFEQFLLSSSEKERSDVIQRRAESTFNAIESIAKHVARVPGRKNLVWVSAGFPLVLTADNYRRFSEVTQRATRAINQANIALYPVDARCLQGFFEVTPSADPERRFFAWSQKQRADRQASLLNMSTTTTTRDLAEQTGGRAFMNSNDIAGSIRAAIEDAEISYTLGYYPSHQKWNGDYHRLEVGAKRKGLRLRHRLGYFAFPDTAPKEDERQASIRASLVSPIDATDLGLTVVLEPEALAKGRVRLEVRLRAGEIRFAEINGLYTAAFDMVVAQHDAEGRQLTAESNKIDLRVRGETYKGFLRDGISVGAEVQRISGARSLKLVVSDTGGPAIGSVAIPLDASSN